MKDLAIALVLLPAVSASSWPWPKRCPQTEQEAATWGLKPGTVGIVGGGFVPQDEVTKTYPWIVSIYSHKGGDDCGNVCGGALISPGVVLTAGHCVSDSDDMSKPFSPLSRMGIVTSFAGPVPDPETFPKCSGRERFRTEHGVKKIVRYPGFPDGGHKTDIALVFLSSCTNIQSYVKVNADKTIDGHGANATVLGWGNQFKGSEPNDPDPTGTHGDSSCLKKITLPVFNGDDGFDDDCHKAGNGGGQNGVCMPSNPTGPAAGDSGGPLALKDASGAWSIIGVVSGGDPYPKDPTKHTNALFTRVAEKADWIKQQLKEDTCAPNPTITV